MGASPITIDELRTIRDLMDRGYRDKEISRKVARNAGTICKIRNYGHALDSELAKVKQVSTIDYTPHTITATTRTPLEGAPVVSLIKNIMETDWDNSTKLAIIEIILQEEGHRGGKTQLNGQRKAVPNTDRTSGYGPTGDAGF